MLLVGPYYMCKLKEALQDLRF